MDMDPRPHNDDGHGTYLVLTFTPGRFKIEGYPPLTQTACCRVTSSLSTTLASQLAD